MIVTLTPNPSLDKTYHVGVLSRGEVMRISDMSVEAAGKGVNVARALHSNGHGVMAVLPVGGPDGSRYVDLLGRDGVPFRSVPIAGNLRTNVSVVEADGVVTKLNEPGPLLSAAETEMLVATAIGTCVSGDWLVASGSLPLGVSGDFYAQLASRARQAGVRLALDASGSGLAAGVEGAPALIKPNVEELRQLTGLALTTVHEVVDAAARLVDRGVGRVLVSMGAEGAVLVGPEGAIHGAVSVDAVRNTVGAGDTLLAGFLAGGSDSHVALSTALTWARAAVRSPDTAMATPHDDDRRAVSISDTVPGDLVVQGI